MIGQRRLMEFTGGTVSHRLPESNGWTPPRVDRNSPAYARASKAGFKIGDPYIAPYQPDLLISDVICICGRLENFAMPIESISAYQKVVDIAMGIELAGAVSAKHLKGDGFTSEQIKQIRKAYV